jgi:AraC-like DNA-binding protein
MTAAISSSATWLRSVVQLFASQGVDPPSLFNAAGVDLDRLKLPHERFLVAEVNRIWEAAVRMSGQVNLGLDLQQVKRHMKLDIASQAMWSGPRLVDGLEGLSHYLILTHDTAGFSVTPERGDSWLTLVHGTSPEVPRQRVEFGMLVLLMLCQKVTRHALRPIGVEFMFPEPADYHPYRMAFQAPLRFGQPANRMKIAKDDLQRPLVRPTDSLFAVHDKVMESRLTRYGAARTSYRASEEIIRRLHMGEPQRQEIALSLGMSESAMEKQLRSEGNPYEELLEGVRKELATHYLAQNGLALTRIISLLGWDLPAQFTEACKRWFGVAPPQARQRLADSGPTTS